MLTCECGDGDFAWWHEGPKPIAPLVTKRARRCCSCKERIAVGDECSAVPRYRNPNYGSIEERIYGEGGEIPMATYFLCDRCAGLYESLDGLGFCVSLDEDLRETCREYAHMQRDAGVFRGQMMRKPPNLMSTSILQRSKADSTADLMRSTARCRVSRSTQAAQQPLAFSLSCVHTVQNNSMSSPCYAACRPLNCPPCRPAGCWTRCVSGFVTCTTAYGRSRPASIGCVPSFASTACATRAKWGSPRSRLFFPG